MVFLHYFPKSRRCLTNVTLRQHVGHYCSWRLLVLLVVTLVLRLVLRLIQGLVLGFVLRLGLRLRLGFPVGQRGRGGGGSGRALTSAADPSLRAVQVCIDGRRSNPRRLPGHRGLVFGTRRRVCARKSKRWLNPSATEHPRGTSLALFLPGGVRVSIGDGT